MSRHPYDIDHLLHLLLGELTGDINEEEHVQLQEWLMESPANKMLYNELREEETLRMLYREQRDFDTASALARVLNHMEKGKERVFRRLLPYAAAILIVAAVSLLFLDSSDNGPIVGNTAGKIADILPGGNKATLTLGNGKVITLDEGQAGIVMAEDHITYQDSASQLVALEAREKRGAHPEMLTLSTPRGGTYQVTLPDGSQVWLNAASTLRYPSKFADNTRVVELSGEAYFSVRKLGSSRSSGEHVGIGKGKNTSFKVISNGQIVEVLGTEFNVSAYPDEPATKTTLVEGKVRVGLPLVTGSKNRSVTITPGQQAVFHNAQVAVKQADINAAISWKLGKITFDGKPFEQVMNEVARWYDLQVIYEGAIPSGKLVGDAFRNQNLSIVLGMLDVLEIDYQLDADHKKLTIR